MAAISSGLPARLSGIILILSSVARAGVDWLQLRCLECFDAVRPIVASVVDYWINPRID